MLNERLKGLVGQDFQGIDRAFVILGLLHGSLAEEHRELEKLVRSQFEKDNRRQHAFLVETLDGDSGVPKLDVPLTCMKCGHTATYEVHDVKEIRFQVGRLSRDAEGRSSSVAQAGSGDGGEATAAGHSGGR